MFYCLFSTMRSAKSTRPQDCVNTGSTLSVVCACAADLVCRWSSAMRCPRLKRLQQRAVWCPIVDDTCGLFSGEFATLGCAPDMERRWCVSVSGPEHPSDSAPDRKLHRVHPPSDRACLPLVSFVPSRLNTRGADPAHGFQRRLLSEVQALDAFCIAARIAQVSAYAPVMT